MIFIRRMKTRSMMSFNVSRKKKTPINQSDDVVSCDDLNFIVSKKAFQLKNPFNPFAIIMTRPTVLILSFPLIHLEKNL